MENFSDREWAMIELQKDPLFHKINTRDTSLFIEESLNIGRTSAEKFKGRNIYDLYEENNILIERATGTGSILNYRLRAEYIKKKDQSTVVLYPKSFSELKSDWNDSLPKNNKLTDEFIEKLHLVHEFFHWYEFSMEKSVPQRLPKVVTMEIPLIKWRKTSTILQTSEIAAHAFTKEFLKLDYFPTYLDYTSLVSKKEISIQELKSLL